MTVLQTASLPLKRWVSHKIKRFLVQQVPPQRRVLLNRKKIFILPTRAGLLFLFTAALVWLAGTNYENNLVLGLAYAMAALFIVAILHTFSNLAGLIIEALEEHPAFAGEDAEITLKLLRTGRRWRESITLQWPAGNLAMMNLLTNSEAQAKLFVPVKQRGWADPGRLRVESVFPLGLLRAWSLVDLDLRVLVYPKPVAAGPIPPSVTATQQGVLKSQRGGDDFDGYKDYRPGDSLKHVDWKHYARGQGLQSKQYSGYVDQQCWLEWDYFVGLDREARLSRLCDWVLSASKTETEFGLRLPGLEIPPYKGVVHKQQLLAALALFECDQSSRRSGGQR